MVKGPLSSLYGPDAIGGVVQIFTRASARPHLFAAGGYGTDSDGRLAAGFTAIEGETTRLVLGRGRATWTRRAPPTRARLLPRPRPRPLRQRLREPEGRRAQLAQGETLALAGFMSRGRARFDGCPDAQGRFANDRNEQTLSGAQHRLLDERTRPWWASRLTVGQGRDELADRGLQPARFETRQDQASWIHEFAIPSGKVLAGVETLRQKVRLRRRRSRRPSATPTRRSASLNADLARLAPRGLASAATTTTSSARATPAPSSYGHRLDRRGHRSRATVGRGFRAPTFFDLYAPVVGLLRAQPGPAPRAERQPRGLGCAASRMGGWQWRLTGFDNRIEDLITYVYPTMQNVRRARIRGLEASVEGTLWGVNVSAVDRGPEAARRGHRATCCRAARERFGRLEASRAFGRLVDLRRRHRERASASTRPTRPPPRACRATRSPTPPCATRPTSTGPSSSSPRTSSTSATSTRVGYDAPRRGVLLNVRFETF